MPDERKKLLALLRAPQALLLKQSHDRASFMALLAPFVGAKKGA